MKTKSIYKTSKNGLKGLLATTGLLGLLFGLGLSNSYAQNKSADAQTHIYVTDSGNNWIAFGGPGTGINQFQFISSHIFVDSAGKIYVTDDGNNRVVRFDDMTGKNSVTLGTRGGGINQFNLPVVIFVDSAGKIYVSD